MLIGVTWDEVGFNDTWRLTKPNSGEKLTQARTANAFIRNDFRTNG
jgi:hypothetical protein